MQRPSLSRIALAAAIPLSFTTPEFRTDIVPEPGDFTVGCLFRLDGFLNIPAHMDFRNGMVFSCESGYFDGFRLFIEEPGVFRPVFEIGRAEGATQFKPDSGLSTGVWHHVSISWQRADSDAPLGTMRLFVDGALCCESAADRPAPILKGAPIRVGYVDYGVGSLDMQARHLFYEPRALSEDEVFARAAESAATVPEAALLRRCLDFAARPHPDVASVLRDAVALGGDLAVPPLALSPERTEVRAKAIRAANRADIDARHTFALPGDAGSDAAVALEKLLADVAALRRAGDMAPVRIVLQPQRYTFSKTVRISGPGFSSLRISVAGASPEKRAVLDGGREIPLSSLGPVTDPDILARLPSDDARERVRCIQASVPATRHPYGCGIDDRHAPLLLVSDSDAPDSLRPLRRAGWPDENFVDGTATPDGLVRAPALDAKRLARWASAPAPLAHGYWKYLWADAALPIRPEGEGFHLAEPHTYGLGETPRFRVCNLLEELDSPGEWYAENGMLYLYPPQDGKADTLHVPLLDEPFFRIEGCCDVALENLELLRTAADGIVANAPWMRLSNLRFAAIGGTAAVLSCGIGCACVEDCRFEQTGHGGLYANAGDRGSLTSSALPLTHGNLLVEDSSFAGIGLLARTYTPAVRLEGCGNIVRGCEFTDTASSAIRLEGNDHVVENSLFLRTVLESDDQGAIDIWGDPTYRGNVIRNNRFEHVGGEGRTDCGRAGVRFDDMISGNWVYGNVFDDAARGGMGGMVIHGGQHNRVFGNLFRNCKAGIVFNPWGKERWEKTLADEWTQTKTRGRIDSSAYLRAYPEIARLHEDADVNTAFGNVFIDCGPTFRGKRAVVTEFGNVAERAK